MNKYLAIATAGLVAMSIYVGYSTLKAAKIAGCVDITLQSMMNQYGPPPAEIRATVISNLIKFCHERLDK